MTYVLFGIGLVLLILVVVNWAANAPPRSILNSGKWIAGILALVVAVGLIAIGRFGLLWMVLIGLLPWISRFLNFRRMWKTMQGPRPGANSSVQSRFFAMTLDHETGEMDGQILEGPHEGRMLSELTLSDLVSLYADVEPMDRKSADLLEAYIDRAHGTEWRGTGTNEEPGGGSDDAGRSSSSGNMSRAEALSVLGLQDGCTSDEIREAHRRMMKSAHPDAGGSDYLAAKVNEAKDVLLGKAKT
ncbi:molecular chaperone DnaJ [Hwanghaeella grinnelliae]|uniref:Molecular chaperone DnaJ n=1 Tax=Hwanghaeella grinnelliae TaxID=2500179 RepID=A0A437QHC3_9PROT|nr:molecular chaperone DnaJ [Hwanghaeella grinnelliae]RVU33824.1 molecular chaperone DnaJ [Hwanghaeella grinnelliae]